MIKRFTPLLTKTHVKFAAVGAEFDDHGKHTMITWVGQPFRNGNNKLVFDAEGVERPTETKRPSRAS